MPGNIRVGKVSSVNAESRTARVVFGDRGDMVSGVLKVLSNSPLITADITTGNNAWTVKESCASAPRGLARGESYTKAEPNVITGELPPQGHRAVIKTYGWLPYIGQTVLCIMTDNSEGAGYIIGGV